MIHYKGIKTKCPVCKKEYLPKFPQNSYSPVQYDEAIHALIVYLSCHCNISNEKISYVLGFVIDGQLQIAPSIVTNTIKSFGKKSKYTISRIKQGLLKQEVIYEDETPINVNVVKRSVIGIFTNNIAERGFRCIESKLEVCGFRNLDFANYYCNAVSIINTCKSQGVNAKTVLTEILSGRKNICKKTIKIFRKFFIAFFAWF